MELKFAPWMRNMLTRCVAIVPSLIVSLIGGSSGAGKLIIASSVVLLCSHFLFMIPILLGEEAGFWFLKLSDLL